MHSPKLLATTLALVTSIALGASALAATQDDATRATPTTGDVVTDPAGEVAAPEADPDTSAQYDCRVIDGREVCDTFDEADEGPGTR